MGRYLFRLPDIGEGIAEAEIVAWHVAVGDRIVEDQSLIDVMTDKATVDMTSPVDGVVVALHGEIGATAAVGSVLAEIEVDDSAGAEAAPSPESSDSRPSADDVALPEKPGPDHSPAEQPRVRGKTVSPRSPGELPLAAPATRRRARSLGIALEDVPGTGRNGRITPEDLDKFAAGDVPSPSQDEPAREAIEEIRIVGLRRRIAEKMSEAKRRIPHFSYVEECDLTELEALRRDLNERHGGARPKLTLLPFLMRALVRVLPEFPDINARYDDEAGVLTRFAAVHIGIATQTPGGLMVPVVRDVAPRDLWDCAREVGRVSAAARDGTAKRDELTGSTITLTSLGALGGIAATPVINHPEVAIVGPNKLVERAVVRNGQVAVRTCMNLSSSFDHRIVDGYDAARFIQSLKRLLEHPALLFLEEDR